MADHSPTTSKPTQAQHLVAYLPLLGAILLSVLNLWVATSVHGIGYQTDSFSYFESAEALVTEGVTSTEYNLIHFPPLLPAILTITGTGNASVLLGVSGLFLIVNLGLLAYLLNLAGIQGLLQAGVVAILGMLPVTLLMHGIFQSEPLFLILLQLAIILLVKERLWWAAIIIALAPLQRYAGVALIGAFGLWVLLRYGLWRALVFGAITSTPIALWMLRNALIADNPGREFGFRLMSSDKLLQGFTSLAPWLLPVIALSIGTYFVARHRPDMPRVIVLSGLFIGVYSTFLLFSISFFDHFTPLDFRILFPVIWLGWVIAAWFLDVQRRYLNVRGQNLAWIGLVVMVAGYLLLSAVYSITRRPDGLGMVRAIEPIHSEALATLSPDVIIYSNQIYLLQILGYEAVMPPANLFTPEDDEQYDAGMGEVIAQVKSGEAVIVWFEDFITTQLIPPDELKTLLPYELYDGMLLFRPATS